MALNKRTYLRKSLYMAPKMQRSYTIVSHNGGHRYAQGEETRLVFEANT